jgi:hypothetical protein
VRRDERDPQGEGHGKDSAKGRSNHSAESDGKESAESQGKNGANPAMTCRAMQANDFAHFQTAYLWSVRTGRTWCPAN